MDQLKKHAFWVAMGGLLVVALALYFLVIFAGLDSEIDAKTKTLEQRVKSLERYAKIPDDMLADPEQGMPVKEQVKQFDEKLAALEEAEKAILETYRKRDGQLEALFDKVKPKKKDDPVDVAAYAAEYNEQLKRLETKELAGLFAGGKPLVEIYPPPDTAEEVRERQKRFWMLQAIGDATKQAGGREIVAVEFKGEAEAKEKDAPWKLLVVHAEVRLPFSGVAKLVGALLKNERVPFEVKELVVQPAPFNIPELQPYEVTIGVPAPVKTFEKDVYIAKQNERGDPRAKDKPPPIGEPLVQAGLDLYVIDFDIPKAEEAEKP